MIVPLCIMLLGKGSSSPSRIREGGRGLSMEGGSAGWDENDEELDGV